MKIKVSKQKFNLHYRGSPWGSRTQQHAYCLRYAHSQHIESHLGKKQPQAKIPIAFLFIRLHFNRVTSNALFYGGHLVMRSKRCPVQNQWITLIAVQILQTSSRLKFSRAIITFHNTNPASRLGSLHYTDLASRGLEGGGRENLKARHYQLYSDGMFSLHWALLKGQKLIFCHGTVTWLSVSRNAKSERDSVVRVPHFKVKSVIRLTLSFLIFYCCITWCTSKLKFSRSVLFFQWFKLKLRILNVNQMIWFIFICFELTVCLALL